MPTKEDLDAVTKAERKAAREAAARTEAEGKVKEERRKARELAEDLEKPDWMGVVRSSVAQVGAHAASGVIRATTGKAAPAIEVIGGSLSVLGGILTGRPAMIAGGISLGGRVLSEESEKLTRKGVERLKGRKAEDGAAVSDAASVREPASARRAA